MQNLSTRRMSHLFGLDSFDTYKTHLNFSSVRSRDSALRAIALTSSKNLLHFHRHLLHSVTLTRATILSLSSLLDADIYKTQFVKSLRLGREDGLQPEIRREVYSEIFAHSLFRPRTEDPRELKKAGVLFKIVATAFKVINQHTLFKLLNLQELIIVDQMFLFDLHEKTITNMRPLPFLVRSLKKLYVPLAESHHISFSARNFIWLMLFCPRLNELAISFICRKET